MEGGNNIIFLGIMGEEKLQWKVEQSSLKRMLFYFNLHLGDKHNGLLRPRNWIHHELVNHDSGLRSKGDRPNRAK